MHKSEISIPMKEVDLYIDDPFGKNDTGGLYNTFRTAYDYYREYGDTVWIAPMHIYLDHKDLNGIGTLHDQSYMEASESLENYFEEDVEDEKTNSELLSCIHARLAYYKAKYPVLEKLKLNSDIGHAFLIQSFERPSVIMEKFGLLKCCVELEALYSDEIKDLLDAERSGNKVGDFNRVLSEFLYSGGNAMDTVSEFVEWPTNNCNTMDHFLDSRKLSSIKQHYGAKTWVIPIHIYQSALQLIGLSDLHSILRKDEALAYATVNNRKKAISKELLRCIDIKFEIIQKSFPYSRLDIENAPGTQLLLDSAAPLNEYTEDFYDYIPLGRITIPKDFQQEIKILAGLGDEEFGFIRTSEIL